MQYRLPPVIDARDPVTAAEFGQPIDWGLSVHGIPDTWRRTRGANVTVAVLDTGLPDHPDLAGAVVDAKDFTGQGVKDREGHSTHCCGTIASRNKDRIVGVAPDAKLLIGKVLGDDGSGDSRGITAGIRWAVESKADVISMSLGGGYDRDTALALLEAVSQGCLVFCAAGNSGPRDNTIEYPAKLSYVVPVSAYNKQGKLADFSSRGPEAFVAFPGEAITSTFLGGRYRTMSGTSMATPFAAGVTALAVSHRRTNRIPPMNQADLKNMIRESAVDHGPPGRDRQWGWGVVDVNKFLTEGVTTVPSPPSQPTPPAGDSLFDFPIPGSSLKVSVSWITHGGVDGFFVSVK